MLPSCSSIKRDVERKVADFNDPEVSISVEMFQNELEFHGDSFEV